MKHILSNATITAILDSAKVKDVKMGDKTTVVCVTFPFGFEIIESSSCVDPLRYDHGIGVQQCMERVKNRLWELEAYVYHKCGIADEKSTMINSSVICDYCDHNGNDSCKQCYSCDEGERNNFKGKMLFKAE